MAATGTLLRASTRFDWKPPPLGSSKVTTQNVVAVNAHNRSAYPQSRMISSRTSHMSLMPQHGEGQGFGTVERAPPVHLYTMACVDLRNMSCCTQFIRGCGI